MKILVIAGVTAAGKTAAAIELARRFGGELIGADSVQVYRGFDIGSAKPTAAELGDIAHHLIDVVDPDEAIDAAKYAELADRAIRDVHSRGALPIVVGGTGLWIRALLRGLVDLPAPDPELRARLERAFDADPAAQHARLASIDPTTAARLHANDRLRIVRALEVYEQTGRPMGELHAEHRLGAPRYDALYYALDRERDELYARIEARTAAMLDAGWIEETRALLERWGPDVRPMGSVGYREIAEHLRAPLPRQELERRIYKSTRIYTRRQRTFLRGEPTAVHWTNAEQLLTSEAIRDWLDRP